MTDYAIALKTDVGRQRSTNEDAGAVFDVPGWEAAFVVCDGMGGLSAGDVAATEAVRVVRETVEDGLEEADADPMGVLQEAFRRANDAVNARNQEERAARRAANGQADGDTLTAEAAAEERALMGTTCVAGAIRGRELFLGHAGDSRAYLWRGGRLIRLTDDHSFVGERVRAGDMTEAEAKTSRFRNIVTRALGIEETVTPDFRRQTLEPGDLLLVCTDGLTTMAEDSEIAGMLYAPSLRTAAPERIVENLVDAANRRGGSDNITVLAVRVPSAATPSLNGEAQRDMTTTRERPRKEASPFGASGLLPALVGAGAMLLALLALLTLFPSLRERLAGTSSGGADNATVRPNGVTATTTAVDFARLKYEKPVKFGKLLARGETLAYAPGFGLYFVGGSTGNVALLNAQGEAQKPVEEVGMAERVKDEQIPPNRVYVAADPQGNVYLSFPQRRVVVKKAPDGMTLTTISGFDRPEAIAVDEKGNIYVSDLNQIKVCRALSPLSTPSSGTPAPSASPSPTAKPAP